MSTTECYDESCGGGCGCKKCPRAQGRKAAVMTMGYTEMAADALVFGEAMAPLGYPTPNFGPEVEEAIKNSSAKRKDKAVANFSEDVEADMAMARIDVMRGRLDELAMKLGSMSQFGEVELDVWMHDKLTLAADYISAVADAAMYGGGVEVEPEEEKMYGEGKRPDYPDVDEDGNRKESMESAVRNAKAKKAKAKKAGIKIS